MIANKKLIKNGNKLFMNHKTSCPINSFAIMRDRSYFQKMITILNKIQIKQCSKQTYDYNNKFYPKHNVNSFEIHTQNICSTIIRNISIHQFISTIKCSLVIILII